MYIFTPITVGNRFRYVTLDNFKSISTRSSLVSVDLSYNKINVTKGNFTLIYLQRDSGNHNGHPSSHGEPIDDSLQIRTSTLSENKYKYKKFDIYKTCKSVYRYCYIILKFLLSILVFHRSES